MVEFISWGVKGEEYRELLEDIHGLAIIAERRDELTVTFEELKKKAGGKKL
jgi:chromosome segregation ATPase